MEMSISSCLARPVTLCGERRSRDRFGVVKEAVLAQLEEKVTRKSHRL